ncbi:MAG: hypothetical protein P8045_16055 [Candidatus Thiodiazotropha sp.]
MEETRPILEDEVPKGQKKIFNALEYTEYPESAWAHAETSIRASFFLGGYSADEEAQQTVLDILNSGAQRVFGLLDFIEEQHFLCGEKGKVKWTKHLSSENPRHLNGMQLDHFESLEKVFTLTTNASP